MRSTFSVYFVFVGLFLLATPLKSAVDSTLRFDNAIYEEQVKTVRFVQSESGFNFPIYNLEAKRPLLLEFDQLKTERDFYQYTLIHCDANWQPTSGMVRTQILEGQGFDNIDDVGFSSGTLMNYSHYRVQLPSENTMPKISGNFLLVVYRNFDERDIVLSRRMMVVNVAGGVNMELLQSRQVDLRATHQQVNFTFNVKADFFMPNPMQDIKTVVLRNGEWMSANYGMKPTVVLGGTFQFNQQLGNQFEGTNQFRYFDLRSLRMSQAGIKQRLNISNQKHVWLVPDQSRKYEKYFNWADINGRVLYDSKDVPMPAGVPLESDYCFVHFSVRSEKELDKPVYIYGEISDWRVQENYRMYYSPESGVYEAVVPLKQGYYNYMYGVFDAETGKLNFSEFEGNHAATENNYMVLVYYRNQTFGYDELIGYGLKNTNTGLK
ncbi:MAG: hypothetical protein RLZZ252_1536 [Bacteroidota bacterium]|jgi:hypothetical protein